MIELKIDNDNIIQLDGIPYCVVIKNKQNIINIICKYRFKLATEKTMDLIKNEILFILNNDPIMTRKQKLKKLKNL
jgi:hypothetical protein